jgi:hypothetical protein
MQKRFFGDFSPQRIEVIEFSQRISAKTQLLLFSAVKNRLDKKDE